MGRTSSRLSRQPAVTLCRLLYGALAWTHFVLQSMSYLCNSFTCRVLFHVCPLLYSYVASPAAAFTMMVNYSYFSLASTTESRCSWGVDRHFDTPGLPPPTRHSRQKIRIILTCATLWCGMLFIFADCRMHAACSLCEINCIPRRPSSRAKRRSTQGTSSPGWRCYQLLCD